MDKEILKYGIILTESTIQNQDYIRFLNIKYNNNIYHMVTINGETKLLCNLTKEVNLTDNIYN